MMTEATRHRAEDEELSEGTADRAEADPTAEVQDEDEEVLLDEPDEPETTDDNTTPPGPPLLPMPDRNDKPCQCGWFEVVDLATRQVVDTTTCRFTTKRKFAPGHDAKLKSMLIRAGVRGWAVREVGQQRFIRPLEVAGRYGFGKQVERGIAARLGGEPVQPTSPAPAGL